jgi:squalene synthase HpnC
MRCMIEAMEPGLRDGLAHYALADKQRSENFPVALRLLPLSVRRHLVAVYDVARTMDDLADEADGDRLRLLHDFGADLERVWDTGPNADVLRRLVPTVRELDLSPEPFRCLLAAGVQDQQVLRYETYDQLLGYCRLSADPVGRLVLAVFGVTDPRAGALSDRVCTALQLLEHCQDVAEDRRNGRIYLPQEDLRAHGVTPADLDAGRASPAVRRLVAFEAERASALLEQGAPLVRMLRGWARVAVAGYVAGGRATVAALRRAGGDVLAASPGPRRRDVVGQGLRLALGAR